MKMYPVAGCVLQTLLVLMISTRVASVFCPRPCSCPQPTELHCTFRSLITIPAAVPKHVERMNLGFNSINEVTDKSFAGLRKLELLMVHGNDIHTLPDGVFRDLMSLQMMKISYNKLKELSRHTLRGLWSLARLHLDHNQLEFIHPDAFQGLTSLRLLQLEGNRLQQLHPATFTTFTVMNRYHVSTVKHLYLSDNGLTALSPMLLGTMPQLENLYLHGNPWTCDCNMRWFHDWKKNSLGVLKCKKDKALPGGQLCPMCSSPRHLQKKELQAVENLICSSPVISGPNRTSLPEDTESEVMSTANFREPFGNISLGLSDEHGNEVDLECSVVEPKGITKINWEQVDELRLASNISLSVDLECPVDRGTYEQLWRLIAYYSNMPANLQRGDMLSKEPHPTYMYRQDSEKDALYYTGVKVNVMAQPEWLMQASAGLQLNRLESSAKIVKLILSMDLSETLDLEQVRRQKRTWVFIESTNTTLKALSAILGRPKQVNCNVHSSGQPQILLMLPDGTKVEAPHTSPDNRVSVTRDGRLVIRSVSHTDTGIYYCIAKVDGDLAVMPFYLTVHESSSPPPGEDATVSSTEVFVGNPISLPCVASGSPDAEINWILPSNNIVSVQAKSSRTLAYSNGTLHVSQSQLLDSGFYKCIAMNQHGVDILVVKITVVRRKGLIRPIGKFQATPQSASGVNTQIIVLTEDAEEASGDTEVAQDAAPINRQDISRRRIPGRRGIHPLRNTGHRPPVIRKPTRSQDENTKHVVESRRRINVSKSKIDPEKWADILAKIRDRNGLNTVTSPPVWNTTELRLTEQTTQSQETTEGLSYGVAVQQKWRQDYPTTPYTPVLSTETETNEHSAPDQTTHDTSNRYLAHNTPETTSKSHTHIIHGTTEPLTVHTTHDISRKNNDKNFDSYKTLNDIFSLPQTTSVPIHAVTIWQANTQSASSSILSTQENRSADINVSRVTTSDRSKTSERSENTDRLNVVASSNNDREISASGSKITLSHNPNEHKTSQEENGKYLSGTESPQLHMQPENTSLGDFNSRATITTASRVTLMPSTAKREPAEQLPLRLRQLNSRRRNGSRRKRPNKKEQNLSEPSWFIATTPVNTPQATIRPTASLKLKIEPLEVTTAKFYTAVRFTVSQAASSGTLSRKENTVSRQHGEPAKTPSLPTSPPKTIHQPLAKLQFKSTSTAPSFPTASPAVGDRKIELSQTVLRILDEASTPHGFHIPMSTSQQINTGSSISPVRLLDTQRASNTEDRKPLLFSDSSSVGLYTAMSQTDVKDNQSGMDFSQLPSPSTSSASMIEHEMKTTIGYTSSSLKTTLLSEQDTTNQAKQTLEKYHTSRVDHFPQSETTLHQKGNIVIDDVPIISTAGTTAAPGTSARTDVAIASSVALHVTLHNKSESQSPDHPLTSLALNLTKGQTHYQNPTPTPVVTTIRTNQFRERPDISTQDMSRIYPHPGRGSIPRGKPSITKNNMQTYTVKAETDAQLPCEARGEPRPFLSWSKVFNGASIAQNTMVHRFEVHPNGTLIIRNAQPMDSGQYLCTVQNQYGADKMMFNLVVLTQQPRVLQLRNREITVHLGGNVDLDCKVEGHPIPRVTWMLPSQVHMAAAPLGVSLQQRLAVLSNGTLRISQASYVDRGVYTCTGSSSVGVDTVSVHLHVLASPPVIQQTQNENITLQEGGSVYIHCTATGNPQPVIQWITPNGSHFTASQFFVEHNLMVFTNGTLYVQRLGPGNSGRYECSASNVVGSSKRTVILATRRNPSSSKASITSLAPQRTDVTYGSKLLLNCVATGDPKPRIIWRTPSKKLVDAQFSFDPRIKVFPNGTITIHSVTEKDSGDYLCMARNKMGDDYVLLRVNVLTKPPKIEQKQQRSSQEVVYGGDLKVDCVASGLPNPEISWALPDGTMINPVKQREHVIGGRRYLVFDNGTLFFNDVGMPEEGDYTCYAVNQIGKDEMRVRVKVKFSTSPPQILDKDQKTFKVFYGETSILRCNAKGEPRPVITWISPTNRAISLALDKYQVLDDGTLVVQKVQRFDGGNYTCIARNNAGHDLKIIQLDVLVTPPIISGLRETASGVKVTAVQGQRKLVDCVAKGTPTPRIMWVLPGNVILPAPYNSNRITVHHNGSLEIRSTKRMDSGRLACIARNEGGEVKMVVNLDVKEVVEIPHIRDPKTETRLLTVGSTMALNCSFEGSALQHVTWILPGGTPLLSGIRFSKFFHPPNGSLIISNPSVGEAGIYRCLGRNSGGLIERTITLSPGGKPKINNQYNSPINVMNGETLLLHCLTNGEPLRLTWTLPSGVVLNMPQRAGRYSVLHNGTLAIQQVSVYDRGPYACRVANEYGSSLLPVSVIVTAYPPRITNGPPSVTYAKRGVAIQLNCVATGMPKVEVAWETPDKTRMAVSVQPRLFGNKYLHPQGSLIIQNPTQRDAGRYRCTARNAIGIDSKTTYLNVV